VVPEISASTASREGGKKSSISQSKGLTFQAR